MSSEKLTTTIPLEDKNRAIAFNITFAEALREGIDVMIPKTVDDIKNKLLELDLKKKKIEKEIKMYNTMLQGLPTIESAREQFKDMLLNAKVKIGKNPTCEKGQWQKWNRVTGFFVTLEQFRIMYKDVKHDEEN